MGPSIRRWRIYARSHERSRWRWPERLAKQASARCPTVPSSSPLWTKLCGPPRTSRSYARYVRTRRSIFSPRTRRLDQALELASHRTCRRFGVLCSGEPLGGHHQYRAGRVPHAVSNDTHPGWAPPMVRWGTEDEEIVFTGCLRHEGRADGTADRDQLRSDIPWQPTHGSIKRPHQGFGRILRQV